MIMGNCCGRVPLLKKSRDVNSKKVTLLILGLDNAGKTTIVKRLVKESVEDVLSTVGFATYDLQHKGCNVSIYDVGGGPKIRDIWQQYYADVHGIIYVVDSSDISKLDECRRVLYKVLRDERIAGKPVLLLANKQDLDDALDEIDVVDRLQLEPLVNQQKCPTLVELCAAKLHPKKMDIGIDNGFKWLIRNVTKDYPSLNNRVLVDVAAQDEAERIALEERKRRLGNLVKDIKENGIDDEDDGDPFKPISQVVKPAIRNGKNNVDRPKSKLLPRLPAVANDDSDDEDVAAVFVTRSSNSEQFFRSDDWGSTDGLLDNPNASIRKTFLQRPKSAGITMDAYSKNKKKKKKRLRLKNNKTGPSPFTDVGPSSVTGPLPAIFDQAYKTEVTDLRKVDNGLKAFSSQTPNELVLDVTHL